MHQSTAQRADTRLPTTGTPPPRPRIRRLLVSLALVSAITGGSALFGADTASAAPPSGEVVFCFKHTNGRPYLYDVTAQVEVSGTLHSRETRRSVDGCFEWSVESGYTWQFRAHARVGRVSWTGTTKPVLVHGGMRHNAGIYVVAEESR